jgi:hypothetical protein
MPETDEYTVRKEMFEVVCCKEGVNTLEAKPEDFKRIAVEAADPLAAQLSDSVREAAKGYQIMFAAKPGIMTDPEVSARVRQMSPSFDRSKM